MDMEIEREPCSTSTPHMDTSRTRRNDVGNIRARSLAGVSQQHNVEQLAAIRRAEVDRASTLGHHP